MTDYRIFIPYFRDFPKAMADIEAFMSRFRDFPMAERKMSKLLAGHPNISHVIEKHDTAPDAATFVQGLDNTTAGYLFPELAVDGELPQSYFTFLAWIPGGPARWLRSSPEEKRELLSLYMADR